MLLFLSALHGKHAGVNFWPRGVHRFLGVGIIRTLTLKLQATIHTKGLGTMSRDLDYRTRYSCRATADVIYVALAWKTVGDA